MIKDLIMRILNEGTIPSDDLRPNWHHFTTNPSIGANYAGRSASSRDGHYPFVMVGALNMSRIKEIRGADYRTASDRNDAYEKAYNEKDLFGRPKYHGIVIRNVPDLPIKPEYSPHTDTSGSHWGDVGVIFTDRLSKDHYIPGTHAPDKHELIYHGRTTTDKPFSTRLDNLR